MYNALCTGEGIGCHCNEVVWEAQTGLQYAQAVVMNESIFFRLFSCFFGFCFVFLRLACETSSKKKRVQSLQNLEIKITLRGWKKDTEKGKEYLKRRMYLTGRTHLRIKTERRNTHIGQINNGTFALNEITKEKIRR